MSRKRKQAKLSTLKQLALQELDSKIKSKENIVKCAQACKYRPGNIARKVKELEELIEKRRQVAIS